MRNVADPIPALKRQLADKVLELLDGWSNTWAAWDARLPASRVSDLRRGKIDTVSLERLIRCLAQLGHSVDLTVTRTPRPQKASTQASRGGVDRGRRDP